MRNYYLLVILVGLVVGYFVMRQVEGRHVLGITQIKFSESDIMMEKLKDGNEKKEFFISKILACIPL